MKVAFHFDSMAHGLGNPYSPAIESLLFSRILSARRVRVATKVYTGDFPLMLLSPDARTVQRAVEMWSREVENGWRRFTKRIEALVETNVFVVCLESVGKEFAAELHDKLDTEKCYMGALEINDAARIHWELYSDSLGLRYRLADKSVSVLFNEATGDEPTDDEKEDEAKRLYEIGFKNVKFELTHGKHTFFDQFHSFEQARRVAEWKTKFGDSLGFMADEVVCRLGDHIPELPDKLWAAIDTFNNAETDEQYAQVSATCRRVLEFVADRLFPPTGSTRDGRKLGNSNYRNRLLAFVEDQTTSNTQIELIASSMELFAQHVEKLQDFANKGVHSEIQREGARRALLRTVFLLGDIVSLRPESFPINPNLDSSFLDGGSPGSI